MGEKVGASVREDRKTLFQDLRDGFVSAGTTLSQQRLIRNLLSQRVLESVFQIGRHAILVEEFGGLERRKPATQLVGGSVNDGLENAERYVLPNHRGGLEEILLFGGSRSIRAASTAWTVAEISIIGTD
jgi:hypothetical protein